MAKYYVYQHIKKGSGIVFYVGSAKMKENGIKTKYPRAFNFSKRSKWWIAEYEKCNGNVRVKIVSHHDTVESSCAEELRLISVIGMACKGTGTLVNRRKQSIVWTEEKRVVSGLSGVNHPNYGKHLSDETKAKKSKALTGDKHHLYGKKLPSSWVENIRNSKLGKQNPMFGKTGKDHPATRRVFNVKTSKVYESVQEAADRCGYKMKTLYNWLSGHRKNPTNLRFI